MPVAAGRPLAMDAPAAALLSINTGSSSLKVAVYELAAAPRRILSAEVRQIGLPSAHLTITDATGATLTEARERLADHDAALARVLGWLREHGGCERLAAVGHRIVHGGTQFTRPQWIDPPMIEELRALVPLAPDHLPQSIAAIATIGKRLPERAASRLFRHGLSPHAAALGPHCWRCRGRWQRGPRAVRLSRPVVRIPRRATPRASIRRVQAGRAVLAHLGNGASMAAVRAGQSVDTSMGFTPAGGLVMSMRTGDLDPGVLVYLLRTQGY